MHKSLIACAVRMLDEAPTGTFKLADLAHNMPTERKFKDSGAMIAPCVIAKVGVMDYKASDCGDLFADRDPESIVRIATTAEQLFHDKSIETYRSAPITIGHPEEDVTIDNASELQKGNLDGVPLADEANGVLTAMIVLSDSEAIDEVESGVNQLSSGTTCNLHRLSDEEAKAKGYDAYKTDIKANHVAIVVAGRNGVAKIADEANEAAVVLADAKAKLSDAEAKLVDAEAARDQGLDTIKKLEAKLVDAEAKLSDEAISALVDKRLAFVQVVASISDCDISGKSEIEAKRIVLADLSEADLADKSDAYIEARFDMALEDADQSSPMAEVLALQAKAKITDKKAEYISPAVEARNKSILRNEGKA